MFKVIFIDGGEGGKRVAKLTETVRNYISKEALTIHRSSSRINENGEYHSLKGYNVAFIHNSDNVNEKLEAVFTLDAQKHNVPLVLYSGGIRGFRLLDGNSCEINDSLLLDKVTPFLESHLSRGFDKIDFSYLFPGEKFLQLETLFKLRKEIIINHESDNFHEANSGINEIFSMFEKMGSLNRAKQKESIYPNDYLNIIEEINKNILKYERKINYIK